MYLGCLAQCLACICVINDHVAFWNFDRQEHSFSGEIKKLKIDTLILVYLKYTLLEQRTVDQPGQQDLCQKEVCFPQLQIVMKSRDVRIESDGKLVSYRRKPKEEADIKCLQVEPRMVRIKKIAGNYGPGIQ